MDSTNTTTEPRKHQEIPAEQGLSLADYFEIVKRRRWLLILPAVLVFAIVAIVAMLLPNKYESRATILIEQPEIGADLVRSTVAGYTHQQLQVVGQRVLSRASLRELIEKHDLYAEERETMPIDDVVGLMRSDIQLETVRGDPLRGRVPEGAIAFVVSYQSRSPTEAQQVVSELTSLFLSENTRQRQQAAQETTRFLGQEAQRLAEQVIEVESRLASFKEANRFSLPEMQDLNMTLMQRREDELRRNEQDQRALDERISRIQSDLAQTDPSRYLDRVRALETEYASLAAVYTERHPDRIKIRRELESLRGEVGAGGAASQVNNPAYDQLQSQLQAALGERRTLLATRAELREQIAEIEQRLSNTSLIESDYRTMTRDHENAVAKLRDLRAKMIQAQLGESLEAEGKAERFELIQPASMPMSPSSPNRPALLFMGFVLALGGGIGTVFTRESLDNTIHGPHGVVRATGFPPLAMIPYIWTDAERASIRQRRLLMALGVIALIAAALTFVHYQIQPLDEWYLELTGQAGLDDNGNGPEGTQP
jgi:polysaccharide biosynthesis transport protein